jgi:hypothetical protein
VPDDFVPFYPEMPCWKAPLRFSEAPRRKFCACRVCEWARARREGEARLGLTAGPVKPGTQEWEALLSLAGAKTTT